MFSYGIQVYCASMVYSDESATLGHFRKVITQIVRGLIVDNLTR